MVSTRIFAALYFFRWIPPYHYYIYSALACMEYVLPWISSMQYGYKIAPPNLIATVISLIGLSEYILGNILEIEYVEHTIQILYLKDICDE